MYSHGPAPSGVPVLVVLGDPHRVLIGGCDLVASIFVLAVAAVVKFSNAKSVGPAVGSPYPKLFGATSWELCIKWVALASASASVRCCNLFLQVGVILTQGTQLSLLLFYLSA